MGLVKRAPQALNGASKMGATGAYSGKQDGRHRRLFGQAKLASQPLKGAGKMSAVAAYREGKIGATGATWVWKDRHHRPRCSILYG